MGASEPAARAYVAAGLSAVELGDEAVVDVREFSLEGRDHAAGAPGGGPRRAVRPLRHHPAPPRAVGRRDARGRRAGRRLARHRDRARLLHGAVPPGRPGRRRVRAGRVLRRPGHAAGVAVLRALGPRRALAGPDAPRRHGGQRAHRVHGGPARAAGAVARRRAALAELRHVPGRVRAGRADRRRPRGAVLAAAAPHRVALVAARVPLPRQRQVPADLDAALPVLRGSPRPAPHRHRRGARGGVPHRAEPAADATRRRRADGGGRPGGRRRAGSRCGRRPGRRGARRGAGPPAGAGPGAPRQVRADARRGHRALPGGPSPHRGPRTGARAVRPPRPGRRYGGAGLGDRPRGARARLRRAVLRRAAGGRRATAGHADGRPARPGRAAPVGGPGRPRRPRGRHRRGR